MRFTTFTALAILSSVTQVYAGPIAYGLCQTGQSFVIFPSFIFKISRTNIIRLQYSSGCLLRSCWIYIRNSSCPCRPRRHTGMQLRVGDVLGDVRSRRIDCTDSLNGRGCSSVLVRTPDPISFLDDLLSYFRFTSVPAVGCTPFLSF